MTNTPALTIAYVGNFEPPHSTENHVARALRNNGHTVHEHQEIRLQSWHTLQQSPRGEFDLVLWTRTGWGDVLPRSLMLDTLTTLSGKDVPIVGYHLDRWWGLPREHEIDTEPFFHVDLLATADGGHAERWHSAGIEHWWAPPGVSEGEAQLGLESRRMRSPIAFVGSWQEYHPEWTHRRDLVEYLRARWKGQCRLWPAPGQHAVRGRDLQNLYASTNVIVGDSCLLGDNPVTWPNVYATNYWSDRIPETLGRGGFLLHPFVEGLNDHYTIGEHLVCYPVGDFDVLDQLITHYLANPRERQRIAAAGRAHTLEHHTYEVRMRQLVDECYRRDLL